MEGIVDVIHCHIENMFEVIMHGQFVVYIYICDI